MSQLEQRAEQRMRRAIEVARTTPEADIPVGAVIYGPDGRQLATGTNRRETDQDPAGHAEIVATREAARALGTWRLDGCELVVTLEPCTMCAGAILGARMKSVVFGAYEPKTGAVGSLIDVLRDPPHIHTVEVRGGVLEAETAALMTGFFDRLR
ncbi:tRNA-adenosine deaminase [Corynebacterium appendicis CIP 107643]|uniref:tRNA-specific adenosine deaminase n=1 Tax=Corynebacterium appendicis CIP 107643 TaxID=1161099 RepID=A0A1N7IPM2_9CORY|nr:nucleoside deaminase [Corynebacterium appendicis]WJY60058.1 tRNA-specific adenosine deaminase [Corynebacterium appendicis CIP 107643]SIS38931.1 tRNA-adenosine deaminase [Corynebacterium appendicis CIP 107643]